MVLTVYRVLSWLSLVNSGSNEDQHTDLHQFLNEAAEENCSRFDCHDKKESYLSPLFNFARVAKSHPSMTGLDAQFAAEKVDDWLTAKGYREAEEGWNREFGGMGDEDYDPRALFMQAWDDIRTLPGESLLQSAWRRAIEGGILEQIKLLPECNGMKRYAQFLTLATELQAMQGSDAILLPCREVGDVLDIDKSTIVAYRKLALKHGFLRVVKPHRFGNAHREATEFNFDVSRLYARLSENAMEWRREMLTRGEITEADL